MDTKTFILGSVGSVGWTPKTFILVVCGVVYGIDDNVFLDTIWEMILRTILWPNYAQAHM